MDFVVTISPLLTTNTFYGLIYILCCSRKGSCLMCMVFDHEVMIITMISLVGRLWGSYKENPSSKDDTQERPLER